MRRRLEIADTLRQRVISARHFGTLPPDGRLPSARTLAAELEADARVIVAAYQVLEREGLVERRPRSRAFFATRPSLTGRASGLTEWLVDVLSDGLSRDIALPAFPEYARRAVETLRLRAACVECNEDQRVWLCRELRDDYGVEATSLRPDALWRDDEPAPELRRVDLLVTTPFHAAAVRAVADRLRTPWLAVTLRRDLLDEIARLLAAGPLYFVGTDPRFAEKVRQVYAALERPGHVRTVTLGEDDVSAIPRGAPAYVMRTARDRLGGVPPHVRALSTLRVFSEESRRELLRFIVKSNVASDAARA
jgi:DNA-binding transcriptional regulator YhcF (GntR family)